MLTEIEVKNFAVIAATRLELGPGMTVLTGSTGAGKSIIVGALGLVLGNRADSTIVRDGADKCEISAHFEIDEALAEWLEEQDLGSEGECLVRRVISREGRSRAWINGHAVTLQTLRELGAGLVDIHGQHANQSLGSRATQRGLLDSFAQHHELLAGAEQTFHAWRGAAAQLLKLSDAQRDRSARLDLLQFQLEELRGLAPETGEAAQLHQEQQLLAHAGRVVEDVAKTVELLGGDDDHSAQATLSQASRLVTGLAELDTRLANVAALLGEADIQVSEALAELSDYGSALDLDPQRRDLVEQRLQLYQALSRKHLVDTDELPGRLLELEAEFEQLNHADAHLERLQAEVDQARKNYDDAANILHDSRKAAAVKLGRAVSAEMQELGMPGGQFVALVERQPDKPAAHGADLVEFLVSANPGQQPRPLGKVASGGELSRIGLAVELLAASHQSVQTMIFDEVDAGIGGAIAEIVGQKLRQLGAALQVLCVTHLPQVASQAHHHVLVSKLSDGEATRTQLVPLGEERRVDEIARMLGGTQITDATRRHAREMLSNLAPAIRADAIDI